MILNPLILALSALVPLLVGFIWYNPKTFGTAWMKAAEMTDDKMKGANMALIFGLTLLLGFMLAVMLNVIVIHQNGLFSLLQGEADIADPNSASSQFLNQAMQTYGDRFRTFGHGALHGTLSGLFFALPVMGVNALFERKSGKYIAINVGFWTVTMAIMGGIICAFS
jgi:hypothetical protein